MQYKGAQSVQSPYTNKAMSSKIKEPHEEKGPLKGYIPANLYSKFHVGKLNLMDPVIGVTIISGYFRLMMGKVVNTLTEEEHNLTKLILFHKQHKFFLATTPPFAIQLFSFFSNYWKGIHLKYTVLLMASLCLFLIYMILRRNNVSILLSVSGVLAIANLPHFQDQSISLSIDVVFWLPFLGVLYFWRLYRNQNGPTLMYLTHIGVFLGLAMSTKSLGFITWFWIICCSLYDTWNTLDDVSISTFSIAKKVTLKFFFILMLPLQIFIFINYRQINNFQLDTPQFSRYVSPYFQSYLRGGKIYTTKDQLLHFGDTITIRHTASLGAYLTSYNVTVDDDSSDQLLVTLAPNEFNEWALWTVENITPSSAFQPVRKFDDIRLRHVKTGKLLRASDAKPPVSEQEYDKMVCTTGDINYEGDRDESWVLQTVGYSTAHFHNDDYFNVTSEHCKLFNQGRSCAMLGHDTRLPDWGFYDQEVLCLDPAMNKFAEFQINVVKSETARMVDIPISSYNKFKLIFEWLARQYKYSYFVKNVDLEHPMSNDIALQIESWPFNSQDDSIVTKNLWPLSVIGVIIFSLFVGVQVLTWNPWKIESNVSKTVSLNRLLFEDIGVEYSLGWLLHLFVFTKSPSRDMLSIVNYIPSYIIGFLLFIQTVNTINKSYHWTMVVIPLYIAVLYKLID